jgi:hypothetical protein
MAERDRAVRTVQILLTIVALEFFGPIVRDFSPSHAFNPQWAGHARVHLVWLLGFMLLSGVANLYLIWWRRPFEIRNLWLSVAWQCCNLGGFWIAYLLVEFTVLSLVLAVAVALLRRLPAGAGGHRATR